MRTILNNISFRDCWLWYIICGGEGSGQPRGPMRALDGLQMVQQGRMTRDMKDRSKKGVGEGDNDRPEDSEPPVPSPALALRPQGWRSTRS